MKKFFLFLICFVFAMGFIFHSVLAYEEKTVHRVVDRGRNWVCGVIERPVHIAGFMNYPPFGWQDIKYRNFDEIPFAIYSGLGVELFKRFAEEFDVSFQFVNVLNNEEAKYALSQGYIDILLGDYYKANSFSTTKYIYPGYISNPIVIVTLKPTGENETVPETWEELKGKKGAMRTEENIFELLYPQIPQEVTIERVEGAKRAYQLLLNKQVDFLVTSLFAHETEMRRFKVGDFLAHSNKPLMSPVIFMSYKDDNPCANFILSKLQEKLTEYTADENLMRSILSEQIINWENKFADQKSLMFEIDQEPETNEEKSEENMDLDKWLQEQRNILEREAIQNSVKASVGLF